MAKRRNKKRMDDLERKLNPDDEIRVVVDWGSDDDQEEKRNGENVINIYWDDINPDDETT